MSTNNKQITINSLLKAEFGKDEMSDDAGGKHRSVAARLDVAGCHNPCFVLGRTWDILMPDASPNRHATLSQQY